MSTYVLMRILESAPRRYDFGIRLLTCGSLDKAYNRLASRIEHGKLVLDIGCGTGALTLRAARRGAKVKGIDINPQMLEIARKKAQEAGLSETIELVEMGVAELDGEKMARYDVVMCGLCLSELSEDEVKYTLGEAARILRPGGLLLVADEIIAQNFVKRWIHFLFRIPLAALAYLITQQTTRPAANLPQKLISAGFSIVSTRTNLLGDFGEFVAQKPASAAP